ncbi:MAG: hypothetical protein A2Z40_01610 [Deltaproteobacteria bacterium RBG_19FT_COMBO_60_16]|nr:MAG: hypothetical protein A2Z40_01610 [Deltaproteobacteria bacterium RBG_19FT_COMBO_60_16]
METMKSGRRFFLLAFGGVAASAGVFRSRSGLRLLLAKAGGETVPRAAADPFVREGRSLVAAVGGRDPGEMVRKAVSLIGGFGPIGLAGRSVLVKPNVVGGNRNPTTTSPAVVSAVVRALHAEGAGKVYVGDMSALIRGSTAENMERTGIAKAARDAGADLVSFEDHGWVRVKVKGKHLRDVSVTEWIYRVDRVVNLPVIKTHRYAGYSICLKNFVGATHLSYRPYLVNPLHWEEVVAELNLAYRPDLNVVDGTKVMVEGGPWEGEAEPANLVLAGGDRIACDVVGLAVIKAFGRWEPLRSSSPWEMGQVRRAVELGLGARSGKDLELVTASIDGDRDFPALMAKAKSFL